MQVDVLENEAGTPDLASLILNLAVHARRRFDLAAVMTLSEHEWYEIADGMQHWLDGHYDAMTRDPVPRRVRDRLDHAIQTLLARSGPVIAAQEDRIGYEPRLRVQIEDCGLVITGDRSQPVEIRFWRLASIVWLTLNQACAIGTHPRELRAVLPVKPAGDVEPRVAPAVAVERAAPNQEPETPPLDERISHAEPTGEQRCEVAPLAEPAKATDIDPQIRLHGRRLRSSVIPTWLGLVVFSWFAILWGGLITAPLGLGLGVLASAFAGIVLVPLWGTVWGLVGMSAARASTLRQMKFEELPEDHPIAIETFKLAEALEIKRPQIGLVPAYNAFAMGRHADDATVVIGKPLLETLTVDEQRAVIGHELGHVVSGDMRRMMLMRTFQNACVWFALAQELKQFVRWTISWAAELFILAFSRKREYWADAIGAALAGKEAMIGALRKLEDGPSPTGAERQNARFMFRGRAVTLFSTHPKTSQRIAALEAETYLRRLPQHKG